jgi:hypothetical protein
VICIKKIHTSIVSAGHPANIDLKGDAFRKSNKAFQCMGKGLRKVGLATVNHYPPIKDTDLAKMYTLFASNPDDAQLLQYKVSQHFIFYIQVK